jgi:methionine-rich copper-binding protein CopC
VQSTRTFTTSFDPDTTAPTVVETNPGEGLANVPINAVVQVLFDEPVDPTSIAQVNVLQGAAVLDTSRALSNGNRTITLTPTTLLATSTLHQISIAGVRDTAGNPLAVPVTTTFTAGSGADFLGPSVDAFFPADNSTNVAVGTTVEVTFSEAINSLSVFDDNVVLREQNTNLIVPTTVSFSADFRTVTLTPLALLANATQYTIALNIISVTDVAGNRVPSAPTATFTTQ